MSKIKIGLPSKGRLKDETLAFLKSKNLEEINSLGKEIIFLILKIITN